MPKIYIITDNRSSSSVSCCDDLNYLPLPNFDTEYNPNLNTVADNKSDNTSTRTGTTGSDFDHVKNMKKYYKKLANQEKLKARIQKYNDQIKYLQGKIKDLEQWVID